MSNCSYPISPINDLPVHPFISMDQIANLVTLQGEDRPFIRNVLTLKACSPIVGVDVISFDTERDVLLAWRVNYFIVPAFV